MNIAKIANLIKVKSVELKACPTFVGMNHSFRKDGELRATTYKHFFVLQKTVDRVNTMTYIDISHLVDIELYDFGCNLSYLGSKGTAKDIEAKLKRSLKQAKGMKTFIDNQLY